MCDKPCVKTNNNNNNNKRYYRPLRVAARASMSMCALCVLNGLGVDRGPAGAESLDWEARSEVGGNMGGAEGQRGRAHTYGYMCAPACFFSGAPESCIFTQICGVDFV